MGKRSSIRRIGLGVSVLVILAVGVVIGPTTLARLVPGTARLYTRWLPPEPTPQVDRLSDQERRGFQSLGQQSPGRVVWSSNREGNHELYLVDLETGAEKRLTDHPHVDFFSRFSPNGSHISFLRSQREWVSFREEESWDLYLIDSDGSNERLLAREAYHPTWVPDGSGLVFVRQNRIIRYDLVAGDETVLHRGEDPPTRGTVQEPELLTDSLVALTLRHVPEESVGVLDLTTGSYTPVSTSRACQITWIPGRRHLVWMDDGGRGGTRVMHGSMDGPQGEVLMDLPHEYSHEYFPRITADGEWMIWGAAAEGHEHDRADYELFAWKLDQPWSSAVRLTYSESNDQWPDFYRGG